MSLSNKNCKTLIGISQFYGNDQLMVQGGGGNTSFKNQNSIWVKSTGKILKHIKNINDFVCMDISTINGILKNETLVNLPDNQRDSLINTQVNKAAIHNTLSRPSIEIFLHTLMKDAYTVHTHPVYVNGLLCSANGKDKTFEIFDKSSILWIEYKKPGYPLGIELLNEMKKHHDSHGNYPSIVFLQNHGIIVSGASAGEILKHTDYINENLYAHFGRPEALCATSGYNNSTIIENISKTLLGNFKTNTNFSNLILKQSSDDWVNSIAYDDTLLSNMLNGNIFPDQVVYCGTGPLVSINVESNKLKRDYQEFVEKNKHSPCYIVVPECGVFLIGKNNKEIEVREEILKATIIIMTLILIDDQPNFISQTETSYLMNWEAEKYRAKSIK